MQSIHFLLFVIWGLVAHIIADWFLQNEWMAQNKTNWRHPAAWVHSGIHGAALLFVFPWTIALLLMASHLIIDLRVLLIWWRKTIKMTTEGPVAIHVAFWQDQAAHLLCLVAAAQFCAYH